MTEENNIENQAPAQPTFAVEEQYIKDGKILGRFDNIQQVLDLAVANSGSAQVESDQAPAPVAEAPAESPQLTNLQIDSAPEQPQGEMTHERMLELVTEFSSNDGKLKDDTYADLETKGFSREVVDDYIDGQVAKQQLNTMKVAEMVGGMDKAQNAMDWAAQNLNSSEIEEINYTLSTSPVAAQAAIIRDLIARSGGGVTRTVQGQMPTNLGAEPFKSKQDLREAMADPRYKSGGSFYDEVWARARASKF